MAEGEKKKRSPLPIVAVLVVIVQALVAAIWFTRPQAEDPANAPPPEMGPDTAQTAPSGSTQPQTASVETATVATAAADPIASPASASP